MSDSFTDPILVAGLVAGTCGVIALVHAHVQGRLLRRRIANGIGTAIVDPATGLFSAAATWQCIRAEANRAGRLDRELDVWIGAAQDAPALEHRARELAFTLPRGAMGMRVDRHRICIVTCAPGTPPPKLVDGLDWSYRQIPPGEHAAHHVLAFVSEAVGA